MRFLLDTNILIPLEDSSHVLEASLANFVRLAHEHNHQLLYHPASEDDFQRDNNKERLKQNLDRIKLFTRLENRPTCPWNFPETGSNDVVDNEILYALYCDAAHALVTEDRGIHDKAKIHGLVDRVYTIQTAEDWLRRLHEKTQVQLPNIEEVPLFTLTPYLETEFFNSLRDSYPAFDNWFKEKAREGKMAWITWEKTGALGAICIYAHQVNEIITENNLILKGPALKLSTFKVSESVRGRKIGELFLKAAFRYATANHLENIFIHGDLDRQHFLFELLEDFGFAHVGYHSGSEGRDAVYLKPHPVSPPEEKIDPFEYLKRYFPHFRHDEAIGKYIVPIRPEYHLILFPDAERQVLLFEPAITVGNAIKLAYLCHAQTKQINPGDIVLFYRSVDKQAITSIGVVEGYETLKDAGIIASRVKRRTVYSMQEIDEISNKPTKVMLFRLVKHLKQPLSLKWLVKNNIFRGAPQSIMQISHDAFERILGNEQ